LKKEEEKALKRRHSVAVPSGGAPMGMGPPPGTKLPPGAMPMPGMGPGMGMPKFDPSAVQLKKTSPASKSTGGPPPGGVGMLPTGFNPGAVQLKKTTAAPPKPVDKQEESQVDFRNVLKKSDQSEE